MPGIPADTHPISRRVQTEERSISITPNVAVETSENSCSIYLVQVCYKRQDCRAVENLSTCIVSPFLFPRFRAQVAKPFARLGNLIVNVWHEVLLFRDGNGAPALTALLRMVGRPFCHGLWPARSYAN